jgi:hypothetical protein
MSPETLKVLDKVKKLFALANNEGAAEGERDNAMRMAQALLRKHGLDEKQLGFAGMEQHEVGAVDMPKWCRITINSCAELFGCFGYKDGERQKIIGPAAACVTAEYVGRFMIESIERQARNLSSVSALDSLFAGAARTRITEQYKEEFKLAAAAALREKIKKMLSEQEKAGTALAEAFAAEVSGGLRRIRPTGLTKANAVTQGAAYGSSLNPSAQVGGANAPLRLKGN